MYSYNPSTPELEDPQNPSGTYVPENSFDWDSFYDGSLSYPAEPEEPSEPTGGNWWQNIFG